MEQKAAKECASTNHSALYRGLNDYKSIYIKSLIDQNTQLRIKALQGIIRCSKKLGKAYDSYKKELYDLLGTKRIAHTPNISSRHTVAHPVAHSKKSVKHLSVLQNKLMRVVLRHGFIEFYFSYPVSHLASSMKYDRKRRVYVYTIEIPATVACRYKNYRLKSIRSMRIRQIDAKHLRIVFTHPSKMHIALHNEGSKLVVFVNAKSAQQYVAKQGHTQHIKKIASPYLLNANKVIVIDAGHGGKDSGAIGYKRKKEKDIVLQIAKKVYAKLKKAGYKVYLTRRGDYFVTLRNRTKFANRVKANLFISIHANAAPTKSKYLMMQGLETFYLSPARSARAKRIAALENRVDMKNLSYYSKNVFLDFINREKTIMSNKLAIDIQRNILYALRKHFKVVDGGVRPGPFWVLVGAQMPSILIEVGYITNPTEAMHISNPYYQNLIAEGVVSGVESYFRHNQ